MRTFLTFCICLPLLGFTQDDLKYGVFPLVDGKVNYTKVFEVDSSKKETLFVKVKDWAVVGYKSQKAALQSEDKESGFIAYKGYLPIILTYPGGLLKGKSYSVDLYHTLRFYIKDDKIKIVFSDLETVSHDAASQYISNRTGKAEQNRIEDWDVGIENYSAKKQEKIKETQTEQAKEVDKQILRFIDDIIKTLSVKKSEFDF